MDLETVFEFSSGKNDWNTIEIGLHDDRIVVRDEIGMLELDDDDIDQLMDGIDQARRRLRENQRRPTKPTKSEEEESRQEAEEPSETTADEPDDTDEEEEEEIQSTGIGPQFPGSDQSF